MMRGQLNFTLNYKKLHTVVQLVQNTQLEWYLEMTKNIRKIIIRQDGMMLVSVMIIAAVLILIGFSIANLTISQYSISNKKTFNANALMVAEAGIEQSVKQINEDGDFTGYTTDQVFFDNATQGKGVFTTSVADDPGDTNAKIITSTGNVYRYNKPTQVVSSHLVKVTIVGTGSTGYSVHTGPGGLILGGSANITNSDVFVNGTITLNGAAKIGTYAQPLEVKVANQACPTGASPGPTYPQVCASGQPISTAWSTAIYGTVCATHQTSNNYPSGNPSGNILPGSTGLGLQIGCTAPPVAPPSYDKAAQVAAVTTTVAGNNINYNCSSWQNPNGFVRTWPANIKLTGNVNWQSSCDLTITGDAYITGNLNIGGAAKIRVANSVGTDRPVVIVDGTITTGGSAQMIANASGTGIHFISFKASASCNPNCVTLTGNDLKTSQNQTTVNVGGAANLPGMIFQSYWGKIVLGGSGNMGSAIGQTVDLSGAGTITFGTALSSGDKTWTITSYQQKFNN